MGLVVRLTFSGFGTLELDHGTFVAWSASLFENGFSAFYNNWSDYLPGYPYVLWVLGKINAFNIVPQVLLFKLPAILSDLISGYLIYRILRESKGTKLALIGVCIYIFNPAIFANSALWGQVDSFIALFSILSIYLLPDNFILSAVSLSIGTLIKPQVAFLVPLIILIMIRYKFSFKKILAYGFVGLFIFILMFLPFKNEPNLFNFIISRLTLSANQYPYTSVNVFNFWGLFGQWKPDNYYFQFGGYITFLVSFAFLSKKLWKAQDFEYKVAAFIFAFTVLFFTRMHERHMLPLFAPLTILAAGEFVYLIPLAGFSLVYLLNLFYSYKWISENFLVSFDPFPVIILGLASFCIMLFAMVNLTKIKAMIKTVADFFNKGRHSVKEDLPKIKLSQKIIKAILVLILTFAFITRIYNLGNPTKEYFDEVYHAFTAKVMMHTDANKAWEWWNTPPEGFAYEWTHPPLAKLGMALGMKLFGENSFGYRFPGAVLGTLSIYLIYLIARHLFKDELVGLLSAAVFSLDGLPLVMSRIGMNDSYFLFFALLSIYMFMRSKNLLSALAFGLSLASKWSAIWAVPILGIIWLRRSFKGQAFKVSAFRPLFWFSLLPFTFYLLTYLPMFLTGHDLSTWWGMQKQMWWYHTGLKATHPYTSMWWSWPFLIRPVYLYTSDEVGGFVARIYAMGNPLVFWFGLSSVITGFIYALIEKNKKIGFIVFSYLIFFVPWALSPRIMFFYHYLPSVPFLAIASGYVLRRNPKLILGYLFIGLLVFIYFYPHWAGLQIPLWLDKSYYWISSWR